MKKLRNIRMVNLLITMLIVVMVSTSTLIAIGYKSINGINGNLKSMYSNNLVPMSQLSEMTRYFMMIRISAVKCIWGSYDTNEAAKVTNFKYKLEEIEKQYISGISSDEERKAYESFKTAAKDYFNTWDEVKAIRIYDDVVPKDNLSSFSAKGEEIISTLESLIKINSLQADSSKSKSQIVHAESIKQFLMLGGLAVVLSAAIATLILIIIRSSIKEIIRDLDTVANGDLAFEVDDYGNNEFAVMRKALKKSVVSIKGILSSIKQNAETLNEQASSLSAISEEMTSSSQEVANATQEVAKGATGQAQDLVATSNSVENFGHDIDNIVSSIDSVEKKAKNIDVMAKGSNEKLGILVSSVSNLSSSFNSVSTRIEGLGENINEIQKITSLINSISEQTNLLALNAAIEAARAGEVGRGFAVVAEEIRKLAEESKRSSDNINSLLNRILSETKDVVINTNNVGNNLVGQVTVIEQSIESFKDIISEINNILPQIEDVNKSAVYLSKQKEEITGSVETASSIAEETAAAAEEIASSAQEMNASSEEVANTAQILTEMTDNMAREVNKFKL
jgi:methyl-accepting chemotaxis protein